MAQSFVPLLRLFAILIYYTIRYIIRSFRAPKKNEEKAVLNKRPQEIKKEKIKKTKTGVDEGKNFKRLLARKYGNVAYDIKTEKRVIDCKAWHWRYIKDSSELSPIELDFIQELVDRNNLAKLLDMTYELHCAEEISPGWKEALILNKITFIQS